MNLGGENQSPDSHALALSLAVQKSWAISVSNSSFSACPSSFPSSSSPLRLASTPWRQEDTNLRAAWVTLEIGSLSHGPLPLLGEHLILKFVCAHVCVCACVFLKQVFYVSLAVLEHTV